MRRSGEGNIPHSVTIKTQLSLQLQGTLHSNSPITACSLQRAAVSPYGDSDGSPYRGKGVYLIFYLFIYLFTCALLDAMPQVSELPTRLCLWKHHRLNMARKQLLMQIQTNTQINNKIK